MPLFGTTHRKKILVFSFSGILLLFIILLLFKLKHPEVTIAKASRPFAADTTAVTFWVTGDAMMHLPQYGAALNPKTGVAEFDSCYTYIRPIVNQADVRIVNFETTLAGPEYTGYPKFSAPNVYADAIVRAGFNFFVFANNHACDRGAMGMEGNLAFADSAKLWHTGTFRNENERENTYPYIFTINGWKIAMLNATYGTNGIAAPSPFLVNMIDTSQIAEDIEKAKMQKPDAILMAIHWGEEYQHKPNDNQKEIADFLLRHGVDVIMGSHPHVVQPIELMNVPGSGSYKDRLVIWSLGNFISNQKDPLTDAGLMVGFTLKKSRYGRPDIVNIQYLPFYRYKTEKKPGYFIMPAKLTEQNLSKLIPGAEDQEDFLSVIKDTRSKMPNDFRIVEYGK